MTSDSQNTPEEAKYWRDKHVLEMVGGIARVNKATATKTILGVSPENYDTIKAGRKPYTLYEFKKHIRKWLHIDDDEILDIVLSGMIAEKVGGDPLWLFLIAPPGGSKTELLRSFNNPDYFHHLSDMTSKTLITGLMVSGENEND